MRWVFKTVTSYLGSGLWWVTQALWGPQILHRIQQFMPVWLLNPVDHMGDVAHYSFIYGPPTLLFILGTYFAIRGPTAHDQVANSVEILAIRSSHPQRIRGQQYHEVGLRFTNRGRHNVLVLHPKIKGTALFPIPSDADRNFDGYCELKFINGGNYTDLERQLAPSESAETGIAVQSLPGDAFYAFIPDFLRKVFGRPKYFKVKYEVESGGKMTTVEVIK